MENQFSASGRNPKYFLLLYAGGQHRKFDRQEKQKENLCQSKEKKEEKQKETESFFVVF
ncbi:hypothetical protein [Eubacterium sp. An3]|uniref:hypothetical protein n=1 Tax=Eubacterium sp. An3 TaxID=1965628 RepID=UPI001FA82AF8|nr:hypothetical protein [Eubacterium sp. An3]